MTFPAMQYVYTVAGMYRGKVHGDFDRGQSADIEFPTVSHAAHFVDTVKGITEKVPFLLDCDLSRSHHNAQNPIVTFGQSVVVNVRLNMPYARWTAERIVTAEIDAEFTVSHPDSGA